MDSADGKVSGIMRTLPPQNTKRSLRWQMASSGRNQTASVFSSTQQAVQEAVKVKPASATRLRLALPSMPQRTVLRYFPSLQLRVHSSPSKVKITLSMLPARSCDIYSTGNGTMLMA
ncbi:MAG: hypothetical protein BWY37_01899 [Firmicutes bacterium ADurb.Bin262]|nr:MAG: hypothetical protein BWY37_01899 [Firmicutes bacterium ADurb.Bin262]